MIAVGFTLPVAVMQPAPPPRMFFSSTVSVPANTSKPCGWKSRSIAAVLFQSPDESLTPATMPGNALSSRSIRVSVIGTWDIGGM